jgi:predicted dienelactone hydrolase
MSRLLGFLVLFLLLSHSAGASLRDRLQQARHGAETATIAGLAVAYWLPEEESLPAPLVIFSHGLNGCKTQSTFLMKALASHGYVVVAPDHQDALCGARSAGKRLPQEKLKDPAAWSDRTHADRADDIRRLYAALRADEKWRKRINWDRVALAGHSLGGYTVIGLAGGWKGWKMKGVRAILALSPYMSPYLANGDLGRISVPVMYQTGTRDLGIAPFLKRADGAYDRTPSPAWLVEFEGAGHFAWTDLQKATQQDIADYSLWFLDRTLKGSDAPLLRRAGVRALRSK